MLVNIIYIYIYIYSVYANLCVNNNTYFERFLYNLLYNDVYNGDWKQYHFQVSSSIPAKDMLCF